MPERTPQAQLARSLGTLFAIYLCTPYSQRLGAFAVSARPGVRGFPTLGLLCPIRLFSRASGFRMGLPSPTVHSPCHPLRSLPCSLVGLKRDDLGGVFLTALSALCGFPSLGRGYIRLTSITFFGKRCLSRFGPTSVMMRYGFGLTS